MAAITHPIIVIGSSAGGWEALPAVLESLQPELPASVFVVQHLSSDSVGTAFLNHLAKVSALPCAFAIDDEPIVPGRVYLAPPDHHLLITKNQVRITKGPRENGFRPSIDTTFRSAAAHHDGGVIGAILTGMRDDGVEGLAAIARSGGITLVQDPVNAPFPEMPQAALNYIEIDYVFPAIEMGLILSGLVYHPLKDHAEVPQDVINEAAIAERILTSIETIEQFASGTGYTCPSCGGVLWDVKHDDRVHSYRCHAGHAFSQETLLSLKNKEVEETLWAALRLMEEQKRMLQRIYSLPEEQTAIKRRMDENQQYIDTLRNILLNR